MRRHVRDELEFGFDYLRDNMAVSLDNIVQRSHAYAIVDEVDSILVDEARTPLIISGEPETAAATYYQFARVARTSRARRRHARPPRARRDRALRRGLPLRREVQDGLTGAVDDREGRARARDRQPLRPAQRHPREPPHAGAEGGVAVQARRRLRRPGGRGQDRRRVHGPHHGGPPLERGPPPGDRGEGGRLDPRGERHARDDHPSELLPPLREARRHDRDGEDGGEGVRRDLQPPRRRDPDEPARRTARRERLHLQDARGEVRRRARGHRRAARGRAAGPRRHDRGRDLRVPLAAPEAQRGSRTTC